MRFIFISALARLTSASSDVIASMEFGSDGSNGGCGVRRSSWFTDLLLAAVDIPNVEGETSRIKPVFGRIIGVENAEYIGVLLFLAMEDLEMRDRGFVNISESY